MTYNTKTNKQANGNPTRTKRTKTTDTHRKSPNRFKPSKALISYAVRQAGPQVTNKLDRELHSTTELLLEKQLLIDNKSHGISKLEMKHDLIPQNLHIKPKLAFLEALNKHADTIHNMEKLQEEATKFQQIAKKIQVAQAKLEIEYSKEIFCLLFCQKFKSIGKALLLYVK